MTQILTSQKIIYPNLSYSICGLCFKAHNQLGRFRNEKQYGDILEKLLRNEGVRYDREHTLQASYDGEKKGRNIVDFLIDDKIILELKTKRIIEKTDYFQMKRYLDSSGKKLGIIVNFRQKYLTPKRVAN